MSHHHFLHGHMHTDMSFYKHTFRHTHNSSDCPNKEWNCQTNSTCTLKERRTGHTSSQKVTICYIAEFFQTLSPVASCWAPFRSAEGKLGSVLFLLVGLRKGPSSLSVCDARRLQRSPPSSGRDKRRIQHEASRPSTCVLFTEVASVSIRLTQETREAQRSSSSSWVRLLGRRPAKGPDKGAWLPASAADALRLPSPALCWEDRVHRSHQWRTCMPVMFLCQ